MRTGLGIFPMSGVAAQAEKRLILHQQVIGNGAVRVMTDAAVLNHRRMLIDKRPLIFRMAFKAQISDGILCSDCDFLCREHYGSFHRSTCLSLTG